MKYQLTEEADRDVEKIIKYSVDNFGIKQAERYFDALKNCIQLLADNPDIGHSADDVLPEYLRFPHESMLFFIKSSPRQFLW